MANLRVIGGHTVRIEPQIDAGVSVNMYAELGRRESELASRPRRFQLSTHGYRPFVADADLPPVTGMAGTREPLERLAVANGRTLRLFRDPDNAALRSRFAVSGLRSSDTLAAEVNRIRPVFGAAAVGDNRYWVRDDGQVWERILGTLDPRPINWRDDTPESEGITPLGMAVETGVDDIRRMFLSCFEDRVVRCWQRRRTGASRTFSREREFDLDLAETVVNSVESLWLDVDQQTVAVPGQRSYTTRHLLAVDPTGGIIVEHRLAVVGSSGALPADGEPRWRRTTPEGAANPLGIQRQAGVSEFGHRADREPVQLGGIWADADNIWVINRDDENGNQGVMIFDRDTGIRSITGLSVYSHAQLQAGQSTGQIQICGGVGGQRNATFYVNGLQYGDGDGRMFNMANAPTALMLSGALPDGENEHPGQTPLVPLGDDGLRLGWLCDRRMNVFDLRANRLVLNTEGNLDSIDFSDGRVIGADASTGRLKASPVDQVTTEAPNYAEPTVGASFMLRGWPEADPKKIISFIPVVRAILGVNEDHQLHRWSRIDPGEIDPTEARRLDAEPTLLSGSDTVRAICHASDQVAVLVGASGQSATVRMYDSAPVTPADYQSPDRTISIPAVGYDVRRIRGMAARRHSTIQRNNQIFLLVSAAEGAVSRVRILVFQVSAANVATDVSALTVRGKSDGEGFDAGSNGETLFADTTIEKPHEENWIRGIDWVNDVLMVAFRQNDDEGAKETLCRGFALEDSSGTFSWSRRPALDFSALSTNTRMLTHDGKFMFDSTDDDLSPGTSEGRPVERQFMSAFLSVLYDGKLERNSKYRWDTRRSTRTGAVGCAVIRRNLYAFTKTGLEVRRFRLDEEGEITFPYERIANHTIGLAAPASITVLNDLLYWLGATGGGGLRVWRFGIGPAGDTQPESVTGLGVIGEGKSIEEMLDIIAVSPNGQVEDVIGFSDDTGGHPTYVMHSRTGGISMAYDADAQEWHTRSSIIEDNLTLDPDVLWPWLNYNPQQGAQRVTNSTTWRNRPIFGGYSRQHRGIVATADETDYADIDGGLVLRRRQFSGGERERQRIRYPVLQIDAVYGREGVVRAGDTAEQRIQKKLPKFRLYVSNDGGRTWPHRAAAERTCGPDGGRRPDPIFGLGTSRQRVYRVDWDAPAPFILIGAYQEEAAALVSRKR